MYCIFRMFSTINVLNFQLSIELYYVKFNVLKCCFRIKKNTTAYQSRYSCIGTSYLSNCVRFMLIQLIPTTYTDPSHQKYNNYEYEINNLSKKYKENVIYI